MDTRYGLPAVLTHDEIANTLTLAGWVACRAGRGWCEALFKSDRPLVWFDRGSVSESRGRYYSAQWYSEGEPRLHCAIAELPPHDLSRMWQVFADGRVEL